MGFFWCISVLSPSSSCVSNFVLPCYPEIKALYFRSLCPHHTAVLQNKHSAFWSHSSEGCRGRAECSHGMKNAEIWEPAQLQTAVSTVQPGDGLPWPCAARAGEQLLAQPCFGNLQSKKKERSIRRARQGPAQQRYRFTAEAKRRPAPAPHWFAAVCACTTHLLLQERWVGHRVVKDRITEGLGLAGTSETLCSDPPCPSGVSPSGVPGPPGGRC